MRSPQVRALRDERLARLRLSTIVEPGDARLPVLLEHHGAEGLLDAVRAGRLAGGHVVPEPWTMRTAEADARAQAAVERGRAAAMRWVCPGDPEWPDRLGDLDHGRPVNGVGGAPLGLWVRGPHDLAQLVESSVAVVGARDATTYGCDVAGDLAADLADAHVTVVSGAAYGIDSRAHRGALALDRPTIALLACGADIDYPRAHAAMLARIAETGLVVSEQLPGQTPTKGRFLTRNRLIAGIAVGTVVVEAARRSGALNTLGWAAGIGRISMGVPGPVTSRASVGVHQAMRAGQAIVVTNGEEVLEAIDPIGSRDATLPRAPESALDQLPAGMRAVLEAVSVHRAEHAHTIAARVPCAAEDAELVLSALARDGWVERLDASWRLARRADLSHALSSRTVAG